MLAEAIALLGTIGFFLDVLLHLRTGRRVVALEEEVRANVARAEEGRQAILDAIHGAARAELEAREKALEERIAAAQAELEARAAEVEKAAEMARRGAMGNEAKEAKAIALGELEARVEAMLGPGGVALLKEYAPEAWAWTLKYPQAWERFLGPAIRHLRSGGVMPTPETAPAAATSKKHDW